jgi:acylpyruvate hydrolase
MKICRYQYRETVRLGIHHQNLIFDVEALFREAGEIVPDVVLQANLKSLASSHEIVTHLLADYLQFRQRHHGETSNADGTLAIDPTTVKFLAPIPDPEKFICIGLNYADHCREQGKEPPPHPVLFAKFPNAICGPGDPILLPPITSFVDYEAELGVVIGVGGSNIPEDRALNHIFGYTCINDISARDLQKSDGQWLRAKSMDNFAPTGPWILTRDAVPDPQNLAVQCRVNGQLLQNSNTREMIFPVAHLIAFISKALTLKPGDIISTGTPDGVGVYRNPKISLQPGDRVEVEIEGLGILENPVQARP